MFAGFHGKVYNKRRNEKAIEGIEMERIAEHIVNWQIKKGMLKEADKAAYVYAYETLFMRAVNFLIAVLIGLFMKNLSGVLVFLVAYIPLRTYAGGYHARDSFRCMIFSAILTAAVAAITKLSFLGEMSKGLILFTVIGIACYVGILFFAPVADENKPLDAGERKRYAMRARLISSLEIIAAMICLFLGQKSIGSVLMLVQIIMTVMLILGILNNKRLQSKA